MEIFATTKTKFSSNILKMYFRKEAKKKHLTEEKKYKHENTYLSHKLN